MAAMNAYTSSLRHDKQSATKPYEEGVPFFVPQLSKVKTSVMCQGKSTKLLFKYETNLSNPNVVTPRSLPYRKQGNQSFYTEENLLKRKNLMAHPGVLQIIERFWHTFPCIRQGGTTIPVDDYVDVFVKFYKALVAPSEFAIGEARYIVEKDWAKDSIDGSSMSKKLFFNALFEVADIWTIGISAHEYTNFLNKLFQRVTMTIYDHVKLQWITAFAELNKIRSFDDATSPDEDLGNQKVDSNKRGDEAGPIPHAPRPPYIRTKTQSANALLLPLSPLVSTSTDQQFPQCTATRGQANDSDSNSINGDSDSRTNLPSSRAHNFQRSLTESRLDEGKRLRLEDDTHSESSTARFARLTLPELAPQQVLLPIPSIYLNPDLTGVHEAERAARRRLRHNARLAQRLRRITF